MRTSLIFFFIVITSYRLHAQTATSSDLKSFLAKQDLVFDTLSDKWEEGAFLGNGLLGVMIYRESANAIRFDLGRTDVVDHRQGINPSIGRARLPIGKFVLRTTGTIQKINLRLNLWNAEVSGTIVTNKGTISLQSLVAASTDVILIKTTGTAANLSVLEWKPEKAISPFLTLGRDSIAKYPQNPDGKLTVEGGVTVFEQPLLAGGSYTTGWKQENTGNSQLNFIAISNSFPANTSKAAALKVIRSVSSNRLPSIVRSHQDYWHRFYQKSFISIPDKRLESFWWIQQYKMASATRVDAYPIDLMGPWYKPSPWPKYWWNLNIQLTYYPFFSSNHVELAKPLLKMVTDNIQNLSKNAPEPYQYNSAALARSGPYDMISGVKVLKGNDSTGSSASLELGNLTWLLHVCWQAYEHTMDTAIMRELYPVLVRSVNYYLHVIAKEADGNYHLPYTYSPEYPKGITRDANYDLSVLKWGLNTLQLINKTLGLHDSLAIKWQEVAAHLVEYPKDQYGFRVGRDAAFTESHRHYSHLLMVYPIYDVNWDQLENRELIKRSLEQWKGNNAAWRGYSYTGSGSIYAMMGEGDTTWKLLNEMMKGRFSIKPNTMYLEAGPVIETPLSAVTTMDEMLLQSWGGIIRVFPAIPKSWEEASFDHLLAKGGFEVSAVRKKGNTSFIKIKSLAGQPCVLKANFKGRVKTIGKRSFALIKKGDDVVIDLKKGEEIILYTGAKPGSFTVTAAAGDNNFNYWGLH